ncbi:hypothetical protein ACT3OH_15980 [Vreelandella zhanjiangensis]|uniref:hypothetical protein n=1 Tax=Vreelandella zhanjiangensis TaxID=1121960 RepID=UPI00402A67C7
MNVEAINLRKRLALLDTGQAVTIDTFMDAEGDECGYQTAHAFVLELPDGTWLADCVDSYATTTIH